MTPVFFGSALTSFGVESFLAALLGLAPPPAARPSDRGLIEPTNEMFSGFIFKIQANMDIPRFTAFPDRILVGGNGGDTVQCCWTLSRASGEVGSDVALSKNCRRPSSEHAT